MKSTSMLAIATITVTVACAKPDESPEEGKYALKVPNGLAFSEFKGYEGWQLISISHGDRVMAATLGNPEMIAAYEQGLPGNGKPIPDGAKMAKIHWNPKELATFPQATVPSTQHDIDFMVKDSKRFGDSGGWGWAAFTYDTATGKFTPATTADQPPQANDAKCGFACHTIVESRDYVFTEYAGR
jgi:Cytochrome P460